MSYRTINVSFQDKICYIKFDRPEANNSINECMINELREVLELCEEAITIVVLLGSPEIFCFGGDFQEVQERYLDGLQRESNPEPLYDLWLKLATGPYITISYVRGRANAGGIGFVAASDIVLADQSTQFSLSELLFGLFPACVMPFLIRRMGFQKAHYMTVMTQPITSVQALAWGLVDDCSENIDALLKRHLLRLKHLSKVGITKYKQYVHGLFNTLEDSKAYAVAANKDMFSNPMVVKGILRYLETGKFPWND